jgi:cytosine/adenosine deaminase-related metal-dependent hydrolase
MNINHTEAGESSVLGDLEARLAEAHSAVEAGNRALAERLYREMVAAGVRDVRAYCNLGVLALLIAFPAIVLVPMKWMLS